MNLLCLGADRLVHLRMDRELSGRQCRYLVGRGGYHACRGRRDGGILRAHRGADTGQAGGGGAERLGLGGDE
jgi:hypothetical protein